MDVFVTGLLVAMQLLAISANADTLHDGLRMRPAHRNHGNSYEIWPRMIAAEGTQAAMTLPINWDIAPTACPAGRCQPRPLYPHVHLLSTGEYFLCAIKCVHRPPC